MLHRRLAVAALVVAGLIGCQPAAGPLAEADAAKIRASLDSYIKTTLAADWDGWAANLTDDAIMFPPNGEPAVGKAASVAFVKAYPKISEFTGPAEEVVGSGDVAWARGTYNLKATLPNGQPLVDKGSYLTAFRRTAEGDWKQARIIWHSNLPLPTPAPAPPPRRGR